MTDFLVTHKITFEEQIVAAANSKTACNKMDWRPKDCVVRPINVVAAIKKQQTKEGRA